MTLCPKKKGDEVQELLELAASYYQREKEDFLKKVDSNIQPFKKLNPFPTKNNYSIGTSHVGNYAYNGWFKTKSYYSGETEISTSVALESRYADAIKAIEKYIEDFKVVHKSNLEIIEHNKAVEEKIKALMQCTGIPSTYSESSYKTPRSRNKTTTTHTAGYLQDIRRNISTSQEKIPTLEEIKSNMRLEETYKELKKKILLEETKVEREQKEKEELHQIALLRAKYTPNNASSGQWEIREAILNKDKYLLLAYWLQKNRGDWSDGYDYAETGLEGFTVEEGNSLDQDIYNCISDCIASGSDGDIDGRIFRDCEYNYNRLYDFVTNTQLKKDLDKLNTWYEEE